MSQLHPEEEACRNCDPSSQPGTKQALAKDMGDVS